MIIIISLCNYSRSFCFAPVHLDITSCFITFHFTRFMSARVILCTHPSRVHCDTPGGLGASALCEGWGRGGVSVHASGSHMSSCDHTIQSGQDKNTVKVCVVLLWDMGTSSVLWIKWIVYVDNLGPYINPVVDNLIPSHSQCVKDYSLAGPYQFFPIILHRHRGTTCRSLPIFGSQGPRTGA